MKRNSIKIGIVVLAALLVQSCFVAKKYENPEVDTTDLYRTEEVLDSTSIGTLSWKELFTDAQLQDYINQGIQNNLDLQIALQNMASAEATLKQGKAGYIPSLTGNATWTHQEHLQIVSLVDFLAVLTNMNCQGS